MAFSVAGLWFSKAGFAGKHGLGFLLVMQGHQSKAAFGNSLITDCGNAV